MLSVVLNKLTSFFKIFFFILFIFFILFLFVFAENLRKGGWERENGNIKTE